MTRRTVGNRLRTVGGAPVRLGGGEVDASWDLANICPPFSEWTLKEGAVLEGDELVIPGGSAAAMSPPIAFPPGPTGSLRLQAESFATAPSQHHDPSAGRIWGTLYRKNGQPSSESSTGNAAGFDVGVWASTRWTINNTTNSSTHFHWRVYYGIYSSPNVRFRRPSVTRADPSNAVWSPYGRVTPVVQNLLTHPVPGAGSSWVRNSSAHTLTTVSNPVRPGGGAQVVRSEVSTPTGFVTSLYAVGNPHAPNGPKVVPGREYTSSVWFMSPVAGNQASVRVSFFNGSSSVLHSTGPWVMLPPGVWTRASHTVTTPAGSDNISLTAQARHADSSNAAVGEVAYVGDAMLTEGATLHDWFHGLTPPDAVYTYAWSGDPEVSSSYRIPVLANRE